MIEEINSGRELHYRKEYEQIRIKKFATNIRIELLSLVKTKVDYFLKLDISNLPIEFKSYESSIKR